MGVGDRGRVVEGEGSGLAAEGQGVAYFAFTQYSSAVPRANRARGIRRLDSIEEPRKEQRGTKN